MIECGLFVLIVGGSGAAIGLFFWWIASHNRKWKERRDTEMAAAARWLSVVGESNYQDALRQICGPETEEGYDVATSAVTRPEDDNEFDSNAVVVEIGGHTVGYLSRDDAQRYRRAYGRQAFTVTARIRGGWDRGNRGSGQFGVQIELPL